MNYIYNINSPIGKLTLFSDGKNLTGLWIENQKNFRSALKSNNNFKNLDIFNKVEIWLFKYFNGKNPKINFPILPEGNIFRRQVWNILQQIPYGKITTYGNIAKIIAKQNNLKNMSAQAIGNAVGHNPISVIIPCHRVIGTNGNLTGYAGGLNIKETLLKIEKIDLKNFKKFLAEREGFEPPVRKPYASFQD